MSQEDNSLINQQNNQPNQELIQQPQQQKYPQLDQAQQNNTSQIIAQQINFDQKNLEQHQQQYDQPQQHYQQSQQQYYNPQRQMQPQQQQQQRPQQNYQQQQIDSQYINNDVNQGHPIEHQQYIIPQGLPTVKQNSIVPVNQQWPLNAVISIQPSNQAGPETLLVITDNTLRSADGYRFPTTIICPTCSARIQTTIQKESNSAQHFWACILCIVFPPLSLIPYLCVDCDHIRHYCPTCQSKVGVTYYKCCGRY